MKNIQVICVIIHFAYCIFIPQSNIAQPGCPSINAGNDITVGCSNNCTTLTATVVPTGTTTSYTVSSIPYTPPYPYNTGTPILVNTDDIWSNIINLPFTFCFYGNSYNQIVVGSNGVISFDLAYANGYCDWEFYDLCPSPFLPLNAVFGPYHDIDPSVSGTMYYALLGTYPCRTFVVNWYQIAMFDCYTLIATHQIVIYESTNIIEIYIKDKPLCPLWNDGNAVVGIQNSTGTTGITAPGRNTSQWTAMNEAWRFTPSGAPSYAVTWYDGATVVGTGASVQVCPTATTTYTAEAVYNTCAGNPVTVTDQVTVNYSGFAMSVNPTSAALCQGNGVTLNVTAPPGVTLTWSPATGLNTTSGATVIANPSVSTTYTVTGVDPTGCTVSLAIPVTVGSPPIVSVTPTNSSICQGASVTLSASGATTYQWSPSTGLSSTSGSSVVATPSTTTTYIVTGTDNDGCTAQQSVTVTVSGTLTLSVTPPTPGVCLGDSVSITASGATYYTWSPSTYLSSTTGETVIAYPLTTTTYTVSGADDTFCTGSLNFVVQVALPPQVTITPPSAMICQGYTISLTAHGANTYTWSPPNGLSSTTGSTVNATIDSAITYTVIGNNFGCADSTQVTIDIIESPEINFIADIYEGCEDLVVNFSDLTNPPPESWYWDFGDNSLYTPYTEWPTPPHYYTNPGQYDVSLQVQYDNGCKSSLVIENMITVFPNTTAMFTMNHRNTDLINPEIIFFDNSVNAASWYWDFGDENSPSNNSVYQYPHHKYSCEGDFVVTLVAISMNGCTDTTYDTVHIDPNIFYFLPNTFSPNGDGTNEIFIGKGSGILEGGFEMVIFDRWGKQIFYTSDYNEGWDGKNHNSGGPVKTGTYCYMIQFIDIKGKSHIYNGTINLIR